MSSSTSSFKPAKRWLVVLALLGIFGALEVFTRTRLFGSSKDFRRFAGYDERARKLEEGAGVRFALVGNSSTDRGVDPAALHEALAANGLSATEDLFVADRSRINTWHFMLGKYFFRPGVRPDWVVVTFYENDLEDGNQIEIGRLAQFFTSVRDWPSVFDVDLPDLSQRADFVISSGWATFAAKERIRERVLKGLVPNFEDYALHANGAIYGYERRRAALAAGALRRPGTYRALQRLLQTASESGVRLIFVAYPTRPVPGRLQYEVPEATLAVLRQAKVPFIDLRRVEGLESAEWYEDDVHLNPQGRVPYSKALARELARVVREHGAAVPGS